MILKERTGQLAPSPQVAVPNPPQGEGVRMEVPTGPTTWLCGLDTEHPLLAGAWLGAGSFGVSFC